MAITLHKAQVLSEQVSQQLAGNETEWRGFLRAAGNLYKYPFSEQLMIYAQRPDATAAASYETWNKMGRFVQRGSKGIALFREDGKGLKYVFDVADTSAAQARGKRQAHPHWRMKKRHTDLVFRHLESGYDLEGSGQDYPARLLAVVRAAVEDKLPEMEEQARQAMEGSFYDELDEDNQTALLKTALVNSTAYTVFARMGVDPELYLDSDDFSHMWNFYTPELLAVLGTGVNDIAAPLLREVEREVKRIDREKSRQPLQRRTNGSIMSLAI